MQLVRAICGSGGPIPRPPSSSMPWDASELCLELLFTVLLRNRDRITLLWPRAYEHFAVGASAGAWPSFARCNRPLAYLSSATLA